MYYAYYANGNNDGDTIIFTIKDTKLYIHQVTLSAKDKRKMSKFISKSFERTVCWNKYKTKSENKNTTNEYRYFLQSNFVGVNRLFILIYWNVDDNVKSIKMEDIFYQKVLLRILTSSSIVRTFLTNQLVLI